MFVRMYFTGGKDRTEKWRDYTESIMDYIYVLGLDMIIINVFKYIVKYEIFSNF